MVDLVANDVTQHCLRITDDQHQQLRHWMWSVVITIATRHSGPGGQYSLDLVVSTTCHTGPGGQFYLDLVVSTPWTWWSVLHVTLDVVSQC